MIEWLAAHPWQTAIAAPFAGAALASVAPHARLSWALALLVLSGAAVLALISMLGALAPHPADGASTFSAPLILAASVLCFIAGGGALRAYSAHAAPFAMALALCAAGGWTFALLARDWIGFALGVETAWLAAAGLLALANARAGALNGALRMIAHGGAAAALLLVGAAFIARAAGSVEMTALSSVTDAQLATGGLALVLLALAAKAGLAPLHAWVGAALGRAGAFPALLIGVVALTGALAAIVRVGALAAAAPPLAASIEAMLAGLGALSIAIGSVQAMGAANLHRLAGYAFASQAGCVLLSVSLGSPAGFASALVQMFALTAAMLALLGAAAATRGATLSALDGLGRRHPLAGVAVTAGALSLMGAPLTVGFLGRWRLIEAAVGAGWWWVAGIALLASLAAVFYGGRLIERVYFRRATRVADIDKDPWRHLIVPVLAAAVVAIGLGVEPSSLLEISARAATHIFGGAP